MYVYIYAYIYMYICIYMYMYTYTCIYVYICICINTCINICMYVYVYMHIYIYVCHFFVYITILHIISIILLLYTKPTVFGSKSLAWCFSQQKGGIESAWKSGYRINKYGETSEKSSTCVKFSWCFNPSTITSAN